MKVSELKTILERYGIRPLKSRGQHFLLDGSVVRKAVDAAGISEGDAVLEIGPGPGILTEALLDAGASVLAVELDPKLCRLLAERFEGRAVRILEGDIMKFSNTELCGHMKTARARGYRIVSNLPYNITSDIFRKFLLEEPKPSGITVMVQREVADRVTAVPGEMSALAVMVQTYSDVKRVVRVARGAFWPSPKVESAVIHMKIKDGLELDRFLGGVRPDRYFEIVRAAFAGKRKQIKNSLAGLAGDADRLKNALNVAKIPPDARPEELSLRQWTALAGALGQ